eukprot:GFYU01007098.1.p1 GENE.GFYU01007098.1~~GFYU01007098.1.p1  ORF type:complete len:881 (+),score=255.87 GFYU01007098.1:180-2822(+)
MSEFEAFHLQTAVNNVVGKVESLYAEPPRLFVGTSDGHVLQYHFSEERAPTGASSYHSFLEVKKNVGVGKKPINKLIYVSSLGLLVALGDGCVFGYYGSEMTGVTNIHTGRLASGIAWNEEKGRNQLCIVTKRKLLLYQHTYQQGSHLFQPLKELAIPDTALEVAWYQQKLCLGFRREYSLLSVDTGEVVDLIRLDKLPPVIKQVTESEFFITSDSLLTSRDWSGQRTTRQEIHASSKITNIATSGPYVLLFLHNGGVEVRNLRDSKMYQTIQCADVKCVAEGHDASVFISVKDKIYSLLPLSFDEQVHQLLVSRRVGDAIQLLNQEKFSSADVKNARLKSLYRQAGLICLRDLECDAALVYLMQSDLDPMEIASMYPDLVPSHVTVKPTILAYPNMTALIDAAFERNTSLAGKPTDEVISLKKSFETNVKSLTSQYLQHVRKPDDLDPTEEAVVVDTVLLKLLVDTSSAELKSFVDIPNNCLVEECSDYLYENKKYVALGTFYKNKELDEKALEVWMRLGKGEYIEAGKDGLGETISFLSRLNNEYLVFRYSKWVLDKNPTDSLEIFTRGQRKIPLPVERVLEHLNPYGDHATLKYLEYVVSQENSTEEKYHSRLGELYIEMILQLVDKRTSQPDIARTIVAGSEPSPLGPLRLKLLQFLESSDHYNKRALQNKLAGSPLYPEYVVLLKKLQAYEAALNLLVYTLEDMPAAIRFCYDNHDANKAVYNPLMLELLKVVLSPPGDDQTPQLDQAISFLSEYGREINPVDVLKLLPACMPLAAFNDYLTQIIPSVIHRSRDYQVVKNLSKMENIKVKAVLAQEESRHLVITKDSTCVICGKRISDKVFACYSDNSVVHFKCHQDHKGDKKTNNKYQPVIPHN